MFDLLIKVRLFPVDVHRLPKLNLVGAESKILKQSKLQEVWHNSELMAVNDQAKIYFSLR